MTARELLPFVAAIVAGFVRDNLITERERDTFERSAIETLKHLPDLPVLRESDLETAPDSPPMALPPSIPPDPGDEDEDT